MPRLVAPPLPAGCPWSGWTPPNVDWCEEELCSWVVNPAGTWSNLAYVAFGLWMWHAARRAEDPRLRLFGPASIVVGGFSFAYHASYTYFLQFFDFVGMFVFCFVAITCNAVRLGWLAERRQGPFFAVGVIAFSALVPLVSQTTVPIQAIVGLLIAAILSQEAALWRRDRGAGGGTRYGFYAAALALLAGAALASLLDVTRVWCDPTDHWLQGHAVWHVLSAACLYALFRFYARLPRESFP